MKSVETETAWILEQREAAVEEMRKWDEQLVNFLDRVERETVEAQQREEIALGYRRELNL